MGFFDRFKSRADEGPLPTLASLLEARGLSLDLPGLEPLVPAFEAHRKASERERWADAVADVVRQNLPLPEPWIDAQDHVLPELVPSWRAEREGGWSLGFIDGLSQRIRVGDVVMPEAWLVLWDHVAEDVMEQALTHLSHRSEGGFERLPSGVYRAPWRDGLDAARLLLPEVWSGLFQGQHPFLAVPDASTLLVAPQILLPQLMEEVSKRIQAGEPPIQRAVIERIDDRLMTARLQEPHPMSAPQRELKHLDLLEALRHQDQDLDPALGQSAAMTMLKSSQGKPMSVALWVAGAPALLPESDLIGFVDAKGQPLGIYLRQTLPRIHEIRGEDVDIWGPRRVRYATFPSVEQIERLERFATPDQMRAVLAGPDAKPAPKPQAAPGAPGAPSLQASAPLPKHLQAAGLGMQDSDD